MHEYANTTEKSSWHGTSVQLVRPRPSLSLTTVPPRKCKADEADDQSHEIKQSIDSAQVLKELNKVLQYRAIPVMCYQAFLPNHKPSTVH